MIFCQEVSDEIKSMKFIEFYCLGSRAIVDHYFFFILDKWGREKVNVEGFLSTIDLKQYAHNLWFMDISISEGLP